MCTVKAQFLVESFRCRNGAKQTLRRRVEIVGDDVLGTVLKILDGGILSDREFRRLKRQRYRQGDDDDRCDRPSPCLSRAFRHGSWYTGRWELSRIWEALNDQPSQVSQG
jgi:hypothetical protein